MCLSFPINEIWTVTESTSRNFLQVVRERRKQYLWESSEGLGANTLHDLVVVNISLSNVNRCIDRGARKRPPLQHGDVACGKGPYMAVTSIFPFLLMFSHHCAFVLFELSIFLFRLFGLQAGRDCLKGIMPEGSLIPRRWVSPCLQVLGNVIYLLEI